jgi:hypothetical protein
MGNRHGQVPRQVDRLWVLVGGRLLRPGLEDGRDDPDLTSGGALCRATVAPMRHALRTSSSGIGGSRGVALTIRKLSDR